MNEEAYPRHHDEHDRRKRVHEYPHAQFEIPNHKPLVAGPSNLPPAVLHDLHKQHECEHERYGDGANSYPSRDIGELVEERTNERDYQYERRQGQKEYQPGRYFKPVVHYSFLNISSATCSRPRGTMTR